MIPRNIASLAIASAALLAAGGAGAETKFETFKRGVGEIQSNAFPVTRALVESSCRKGGGSPRARSRCERVNLAAASDGAALWRKATITVRSDCHRDSRDRSAAAMITACLRDAASGGR